MSRKRAVQGGPVRETVGKCRDVGKVRCTTCLEVVGICSTNDRKAPMSNRGGRVKKEGSPQARPYLTQSFGQRLPDLFLNGFRKCRHDILNRHVDV